MLLAHPSLATAGRPVTLVDSSVVLDIVTEDPAWAEWSAEALAQARDDGLLVINPTVTLIAPDCEHVINE